MSHPKLVAAIESLNNGDAGPILGIAFRARAAAVDGEYCQCVEPQLTGTDLMCGACLRNSRNQEIKAVLRIVGHHAFVPGDLLDGLLCAICTGSESWPRHHGVDAIGRLPSGERLVPPYGDTTESRGSAS